MLWPLQSVYLVGLLVKGLLNKGTLNHTTGYVMEIDRFFIWKKIPISKILLTKFRRCSPTDVIDYPDVIENLLRFILKTLPEFPLCIPGLHGKNKNDSDSPHSDELDPFPPLSLSTLC